MLFGTVAGSCPAGTDGGGGATSARARSPCMRRFPPRGGARLATGRGLTPAGAPAPGTAGAWRCGRKPPCGFTSSATWRASPVSRSGSRPARASGRRLYTEEINAAVRGALAAGATEIVVMDCHGSGGGTTFNNLVPDLLDPACEFVVQDRWTEYTGFLEAGCDAALFSRCTRAPGRGAASSRTRSPAPNGRASPARLHERSARGAAPCPRPDRRRSEEGARRPRRRRAVRPRTACEIEVEYHHTNRVDKLRDRAGVEVIDPRRIVRARTTGGPPGVSCSSEETRALRARRRGRRTHARTATRRCARRLAASRSARGASARPRALRRTARCPARRSP